MNDGNNEDEVQSANQLLQQLPDALREQLYEVRNGREERLFGQRNVSLGMVATFLGVLLSMCSMTGCDSHIRIYMLVSLGLALLTGGMLFVAQRRLPRQQGEVIEKIFESLRCGEIPNGNVSSSPRWYEKICERYWGFPFVLMSLSGSTNTTTSPCVPSAGAHRNRSSILFPMCNTSLTNLHIFPEA